MNRLFNREDLQLPFMITFLTLLILIPLSYGTLHFKGARLTFFIAEDRFFEILTFSALFINFLLYGWAFFLSIRTRQKTQHSYLRYLVYGGLTLLFFFGAGEEISWGQRILGIETPEEGAKLNEQEEINIHNLGVFEGDNSIVTVDTLFTIFIFSFTFLLPLLCGVYTPARNFFTSIMPILPIFFGVLPILNFISAKAAKSVFADSYFHPEIPLTQAVQEIKESHYATILLFAAIYIVFSMRQAITKQAK
jgi:hypothetical protein